MASTGYNHTSLSSTPTSPPTLWDVFLSFRGKDTRYTFTDHLYNALQRSGIRTFMDDPKLSSGEVISRALPQAILGSKTYIVVFSENYASSPWCLDELEEILACYKRMKRLVVPVFYYIDPYVVRHQIDSFKVAFEKHQTLFEGEKVNKWRLTLSEVAGFSGYHISENRSQADIVDEVVDRVLLEINPMTLDVAKYPVGLESRVRGISTLLKSDPESVTRIGIHGMGGVGKTTLAKAVYNQHYKQFQGSCFLANVREVSKTEQGLVCLQKQLIGDVLKITNINIGNVDQGIELIRARICSRKVLIVIDDLDDPKPLEFLVGSLPSGSITIITTRNEDLLDSIKVQAKYKVNELDEDQSVQLFAQHAFGDYRIPDKFMELSKDILKRAGGLPLALKVFGSNMLNKPKEEWRWFIDKLKRVPIDDIERKLLISFDALKSTDPMLQNIFLDIACFYIGWKIKAVVQILETYYTYVDRNIDILKKRCMITIDMYGIFGMHDLLRELGKEIARNNFLDEPGKHSRLWEPEDIHTVLKNHEGTEAIHGIIPNFKYAYKLQRATFSAESFKRLSKLRFLYLNNVNLTGSFEQTFKDLRWLRLEYYPLKCLPSEFYPQNLVVLELPHSKMSTMWEQNMVSRKLMTTPGFTRLPCLETLNLAGCSNLEEVPISIGSLERLVCLNLEGCSHLRSLPDSICSLRALEVLTITGCTRLEALPTKLGSIKSLKTLDASRLSVSKLPDSIGRLSNLVELDLRDNENLETLPDSICSLRALEVLTITDCTRLEALPTELGSIESLERLDASGLSVTKLPDSIGRLSNLVELYLSANENLKTLPDSICNLRSLEIFDISNCEKLEELPDQLRMITSLSDISELSNIKGLPPNLERIDAYRCTSLKRLPSLSSLKHLKGLDLTNCEALKEIRGLEETTSLESLSLSSCSFMERLSNLCDLKHLEELDLTNCSGLTEIQGLEELTSLRNLYMAGCNSSLVACTLTKRFFELLSGFGHKVEIFIGQNEFRDWISQPSKDKIRFVRYCTYLGIQLDLQADESHNILAIILAFEDAHYGVMYSVKNIKSGFIWSDRSSNTIESSMIVVLPSSILSIREGDDRIEIKTDKDIICGIHLLYETKINQRR